MKKLRPLPRIELNHPIELEGQQLALPRTEPSLPALEEFFATRRLGADGPTPESLFQWHPRTVEIPLGLAPILEMVTGEEIRFHLRRWIVSERSLCDAYYGPFIGRDSLGYVSSRRRGLIWADQLNTKAAIIAQTVAAFPQKRIVVVSNSREEVRLLYESVMSQLAERPAAALARITHNIDFDESKWVYFGTVSDMQHLTCALGRAIELIFVSPPGHARHEFVPNALQTFSRARIFGIGSDRSTSRLERDWELAYFGFDELQIRRDGSRAKPCGLQIVRYPQQQCLLEQKTGRRLCDQAIVGNRARNSCVLTWANSSTSASVAIIAHDLQHAVNLAKLDAGWQIVRREGSIPPWVKEADRPLVSRRVARTMGDPRRIIVPLADISVAQLADCAVLIYAAGTDGVSEEFRRLSITGNCNRYRQVALLVDFRDGAHPQLLRAFHARMKCYGSWRLPTSLTHPSRVYLEEFLARRGYSCEPA